MPVFAAGRFAIALCLGLVAASALAVTCGNTSAGFEAWKADFAHKAGRRGVKSAGQHALAQASHATRTITADHDQKSFRYTLDTFLSIRGADTIVAQGRRRKARNPGFYAALERKYGVPAGIILSLHGMETAFGAFMCDNRIVSAIVTLAYDCRRSDFFVPHAIPALKLVDRGSLTPQTLGARHGEMGHTQFLPGNALKYGVDGNGDGTVDFYDTTDALSSTANFLWKKGWKRGRGDQPGQPNHHVIEAWNSAAVYQQAIAIMVARIDRPWPDGISSSRRADPATCFHQIGARTSSGPPVTLRTICQNSCATLPEFLLIWPLA